jgi:V/A-type H+-transporting ATPase subunit A
VLGGRLVREGVLQQSALSDRDAYSGPEKTSALAEAVLTVIARCRELAEAGVPADSIEEADFGPLLRAREEVDPHDSAGVALRRDAVLAVLRELM